jgi:hypothetical protein
MTNTTPAPLEDQIDSAIDSLSDQRVALVASNAAELLAELEDPQLAAASLRELARLLDQLSVGAE